jgi:hypothetical protein
MHLPAGQESNFSERKEVISEISEEFHTRFIDFVSFKPKLQVFNNLMDIT